MRFEGGSDQRAEIITSRQTAREIQEALLRVLSIPGVNRETVEHK